MEVILRKKVNALQCILESLSVIKGRNLVQGSHRVKRKCFLYWCDVKGGAAYNLESQLGNYIPTRKFYETVLKGKCHEAVSSHKLQSGKRRCLQSKGQIQLAKRKALGSLMPNLSLLLHLDGSRMSPPAFSGYLGLSRQTGSYRQCQTEERTAFQEKSRDQSVTGDMAYNPSNDVFQPSTASEMAEGKALTPKENNLHCSHPQGNSWTVTFSSCLVGTSRGH